MIESDKKSMAAFIARVEAVEDIDLVMEETISFLPVGGDGKTDIILKDEGKDKVGLFPTLGGGLIMRKCISWASQEVVFKRKGLESI